MEITEIKIDKIRPDPNQPRTFIDEMDLKEMSQSILAKGVINPIELDKDFVIITGERRWRAAKMAGLETVPAKILDIGDNDRLMRQVVENLQRETMSDWDTANAIKRLLSMSPRGKHPKTPITGPTADKGITWLSEKIGKSRAYIAEKLSILEASKPLQKAVKNNEIAGGFIRVIKQTPERYKEAVEKKILAKEFKTRDGALSLVGAIEREENNPDIIKELLDTDYSKYKGVGAAEEVITKISPEINTRVKASYEPAQELGRIIEDLKEWVRSNPRELVGKIHITRIVLNLDLGKALIDEWFNGEKMGIIDVDAVEVLGMAQ